jgi:hypothetical protein
VKAIVLTYDKYHYLTEHMIFQYNKIWPNNPFVFHIPCQKGYPPSIDRENIVYLKSPAAIKKTVLKLLDVLTDDQWIYWCIDDKYPIALDLPKIMAITSWIKNMKEESDIGGILFCRCRNMLKDKSLTGEKIFDEEGNVYLERRGYEQIWIHQYLRVKVIRHLFKNLPDDIPSPKAMDSLKSKVLKPASHRLFVSQRNLAVFGESTTRGMLTQNCYESIVANKLTLPEGFSVASSQKIIMGKLEKEKVPNFFKKWLER